MSLMQPRLVNQHVSQRSDIASILLQRVPKTLLLHSWTANIHHGRSSSNFSYWAGLGISAYAVVASKGRYQNILVAQILPHHAITMDIVMNRKKILNLGVNSEKSYKACIRTNYNGTVAMATSFCRETSNVHLQPIDPNVNVTSGFVEGEHNQQFFFHNFVS